MDFYLKCFCSLQSQNGVDAMVTFSSSKFVAKTTTASTFLSKVSVHLFHSLNHVHLSQNVTVNLAILLALRCTSYLVGSTLNFSMSKVWIYHFSPTVVSKSPGTQINSKITRSLVACQFCVEYDNRLAKIFVVITFSFYFHHRIALNLIWRASVVAIFSLSTKNCAKHGNCAFFQGVMISFVCQHHHTTHLFVQLLPLSVRVVGEIFCIFCKILELSRKEAFSLASFSFTFSFLCFGT